MQDLKKNINVAKVTSKMWNLLTQSLFKSEGEKKTKWL